MAEGLKRDLNDHLVSDTCHGQGCLPPAQVAQDPIQPSLKHLQNPPFTAFLGGTASALPPCE